jgi:hypothetical protein
MQLVAYGAQDIYLTGSPQITFFKVIYRRHTNFSMESVEQTFNGTADFGKKVACTVSRNGDLIHRTYLRVQLPSVTVNVPTGAGTSTGFRWVNWLGHVLVKSVEIEIGGQRIDKHYAAWLHIWNELTQTAGHAVGYANMVGNTPDLTNLTRVASSATAPVTVNGKWLYIPLQWWFCRNPGLALPLIALQYHEVKFNLEFAEKSDCFWAGTLASGSWTTDMSVVSVPPLGTASLFVDYIYLDTDERRRFAQVSHEYLIEQLQFGGDESTSQISNKVKLSFNHPVKALIWAVQPSDNTTSQSSTAFGKQWFNYTDADDLTQSGSVVGTNTFSGASGGAQFVAAHTFFGTGDNPTAMAKIQLNGHDRCSERDGRYWNLIQPYQHFTNIPSLGINVYSFGLKPEEHQPSGTCNFSRIDNAVLNLTLTPNSVKYPANSGAGGVAGSSRSCNIKIFAINYNVLRIMSGMGGMAYSN